MQSTPEYAIVNLQVRILTERSQLDSINPTYLAQSSRVDASQQTKLKATSEEVTEWAKTLPPLAGRPRVARVSLCYELVV